MVSPVEVSTRDLQVDACTEQAKYFVGNEMEGGVFFAAIGRTRHGVGNFMQSRQRLKPQWTYLYSCIRLQWLYEGCSCKVFGYASRKNTESGTSSSQRSQSRAASWAPLTALIGQSPPGDGRDYDSFTPHSQCHFYNTPCLLQTANHKD